MDDIFVTIPTQLDRISLLCSNDAFGPDQFNSFVIRRLQLLVKGQLLSEIFWQSDSAGKTSSKKLKDYLLLICNEQ